VKLLELDTGSSIFSYQAIRGTDSRGATNNVEELGWSKLVERTGTDSCS